MSHTISDDNDMFRPKDDDIIRPKMVLKKVVKRTSKRTSKPLVANFNDFDFDDVINGYNNWK